ncbi:hypothetical protein CHS0354_023827 [Potamilus streckersoni]|uniref:PPIase cyclophilin-type domain-containing protein n=1 Tax=Potamilus streckersoni TaxID=2493646 RepID=A0AAE0RZ82_9BIVA|nr:hypothetical protein CHS0354_023827 [Potamilus streckersoni]
MIETENIEASNQLSKVLVVYNKGDYEKAIHGDSSGLENGIMGLSQIVENYSGTTSADHARLYLGNSYLKLGKIDEAISAFEGISKSSGRFVFAGSLSGLATCYSNLKNYTKAGELYWSAAEHIELDALTPIYLEQASRNYRKAGNGKLSIELLETIKRKFPESEQAKSADFYIDQREITLITSPDNADTTDVYVKFIVGNKKNIIVKLYEKHPETTLELRRCSEEKESVKEFYPKDIEAVNYYSNLRGTLFFKLKNKKESKLDMTRFFFNLSDNRFNDGETTVFGKVVKGLHVIDDLEFRSALHSEVNLINFATNYILKKKGKRLRPILVFLSAGASGGITDATCRGSVLIELLHTATLVHDDVVDQAEVRRNAFTINALWKDRFTVLLGDYMLAKGLLLSVEKQDFKFLQIISESVKQITESEIKQMLASRNLDINEKLYFEIISGKTASLFAASCQMGATSARNGTNEQEQLLTTYGMLLGIAFQIQDDILDFTGNSKTMGKSIGTDIKEKKITLPLIHALNKASPNVKREMLKIIKSDSKRTKDLKYIISFVVENGGIEYATQKGKEYLEKAKRTIHSFETSLYLNELSNLTLTLFNRTG